MFMLSLERGIFSNTNLNVLLPPAPPLHTIHWFPVALKMKANSLCFHGLAPTRVCTLLLTHIPEPLRSFSNSANVLSAVPSTWNAPLTLLHLANSTVHSSFLRISIPFSTVTFLSAVDTEILRLLSPRPLSSPFTAHNAVHN